MSQNRRYYCLHCNEVIVWKDGLWHAAVALRELLEGRASYGKSGVCTINIYDNTHEPR